MFQIFNSRRDGATATGFDQKSFLEGLAALLAESGLDPDSREFVTLFKMLSDDVQWYVELTQTPE